MTDKEYHDRCAALFALLENTLDAAGADYDNDGNVITVNLDDGGTIIINKQPPKHEVWLASPAGGRHFQLAEGAWCDTRDGRELIALLRELLDVVGG